MESVEIDPGLSTFGVHAKDTKKTPTLINSALCANWTAPSTRNDPLGPWLAKLDSLSQRTLRAARLRGSPAHAPPSVRKRWLIYEAAPWTVHSLVLYLATQPTSHAHAPVIATLENEEEHNASEHFLHEQPLPSNWYFAMSR